MRWSRGRATPHSGAPYASGSAQLLCSVSCLGVALVRRGHLPAGQPACRPLPVPGGGRGGTAGAGALPGHGTGAHARRPRWRPLSVRGDTHGSAQGQWKTEEFAIFIAAFRGAELGHCGLSTRTRSRRSSRSRTRCRRCLRRDASA